MLAWLVHEQGIEPHIPVFDKSTRKDGIFSRSDFIYSHGRDLYVCPAGKELLPYRRQFSSRAPVSMPKVSCDIGPRLRPLPPERTLLSQTSRPQGPALDPRGRQGLGTQHRRNGCLRGLPA
jgi:hypothetical protein